MRKNGFTLIELLVVVAIFGILASIAVPNFLNAQVRTKVARSYADMKTVANGVEQLRIDKGVMRVDFWDDDINNDPEIPGADYGATEFDPPLKEGEYILFAWGPGTQDIYKTTGVRLGIPYSSSNGIMSVGEIMMKDGSILDSNPLGGVGGR